MPRQNRNMDLIPGKIRKRGCSSPASSSSSILQNYRFKRAIVVGKRGGSITPVPSWKLLNSRSPASALRAVEYPKYPPSQSGSKAKQAPLSARKLAATLWEMNEIPSPSVKDGFDSRRLKKETRARDRSSRALRSGSFPPHLSDPSHSPVSERTDRSGTVSLRRRTPSISNKPKLINHHGRALDTVSNASLMEIELRSSSQVPTPSTIGVKTRLKDVSNAVTTSKELLKIINRMWGHEDQSSSSMSLISALHAELERARLQVNQLIQEHRSDQNEINYLMKCFAEEKAAWKTKEQQIVEAAIESVAGELEVERKLRRQFESLNKKLGRELSETKESLVKVVKKLESERRAREIMEQVCDGLAKDVSEDKAEMEGRKRESTKVCEETQSEIEEKNAAVDKLRDQLETFLGNKNGKEKGRGSIQLNEEDIAAYLRRTNFGFHRNEIYEEDAGEVDNGVESEEGLVESDLHSIELNMENNKKSYKWNSNAIGGLDPQRYSVDEVIKGKKSTSDNAMRRSSTLQRSISDGLELGSERVQRLGDGIDWERLTELDKPEGKGYGDQMQGYKSVKGLREQILSRSRLAPPKAHASPTRQLWPSRNPTYVGSERTDMLESSSLRTRGIEFKGEFLNTRKSKR